MTLWGEPEQVHMQNVDQEPQHHTNGTHVYNTGTVSQAYLKHDAHRLVQHMDR